MRLLGSTAFFTIALVFVGCSGSDATAPADRVSSGLKIFVSSRSHVGDFLNDPYLTGGDAIQKADDFCNTDPNKPDGNTYKALLVDGVIRDGKTRTNWVLTPNTTYFRPHGDVVIGSTTASAIFGAFYAPLTNSVDAAAITRFVWTGLGSASDFAAGSNCGRWSDGTIGGTGGIGIASQVNGDAFHSFDGACSLTDMHVYCVQQP
jgi:hypothetical protein